jgi:hypothetical protein
MRNRQTRIIIGILVTMVLFASSIALLMYSKQSDMSNYVEGHVEVYVTSKHLNKGDKISSTDITKAFLPKSYLAFTPLTKSEILGRYAKVEMFAKEPLRKEKISPTKPLEKKSPLVKAPSKKSKIKETNVKESVKHDTLSVSLNVFKNIDSSLRKGDTIDILSVLQKKPQSSKSNFITKYIALNVKIDSFLLNNKKSKKYISKDKEGHLLKADSIVFEMSPNEIKNFLSIYYTTQELNSKRVFNSNGNRGHLWMVKCSSQIDSKDEKIKKSMMLDRKRKVYKRKKSVQKISISYEN